MIIHLDALFLMRSSDLPGCQSERATPLTVMPQPSILLDLAPGGVCRASAITAAAGGLLHHRFTLAYSGITPDRQCTSLLHFPSGHPARPLAGTVLYGVRTFLDLVTQTAITRPT